MTDIQQKILQQASGEHRLDPDQQRQYLGTFEERVFAYLKLVDRNNSLLRPQWSRLLEELGAAYPAKFLKISPKLSMSDQVFYMKKAQELGYQATIISEELSSSPFALVLHTDHLVQVSQKNIVDHLHEESQVETEHSKLPFWKRWFSSHE